MFRFKPYLKGSLALMSSLAWCASGHALSPELTCKLTHQHVEAPQLNHFTHAPSSILLRNLKKFLAADSTRLHDYQASVEPESTWFVCNHFATQLFLRSSTFAEPEKFGELEAKTGITFSAAMLPEANKLPIFYVSVANPEANFYHAINAIYLGQDLAGYTDLKNYQLIEPQSGEIFKTVGDFIQRYRPHVTSTTHFTIALSSGLGHTDRNEIQYLTDNISEFDCSL